MQSTERWLPVVGYEGFYEVSDIGRVKSVARILPDGRFWGERLMTPHTNPQGYPVADVRREDKIRRTRIVAHMVAEAFIGPRPDGYHLCHNDGVRGNSRVENLRWDTPSENMYDVSRHGHHVNANKTCCPRRHSLVAPNLVPSKLAKGSRECLACKRARDELKSTTHERFVSVSDARFDEIMRCPV